MGTGMTRMVVSFAAALICGATFRGGEYPTDYFRSPLGIPILLSGSFQELRSGHFHSGLDIKTNATQGYRVYAAGDGQIVRINVSPTGFGNALYVLHPNGYKTVYAHLRNFSADVEEYVRRQQYAQKSFSVEIYPEEGRFPVKKGDVIALSGNSGGSAGPHLHFEIRDAANEWPLNPLLFGLEVADTQAPQISRLKVYALDARSRARIRFTNGRSTEVTRENAGTILVTGANRRYRLADIAEITGSGRIGFGIETRDSHDGSGSRLGLYALTLSRQDIPIYEYRAEKFSFDVTRYINAHVDYAERTRYGRWIQRSYLLPGNRLSSYPIAENRGIVEPAPGVESRFEYKVSDIAGNTSTLAFSVIGAEQNVMVEASDEDRGISAESGMPLTFEADGIRAVFNESAFYDDFDFSYDVTGADAQSMSPKHALHDAYTPVHSSFDLSILADVPTPLRKVAAIAYVNEDGKTSYRPAVYRDGWVNASVRALGLYYVTADTVKPRIRPINIQNGKDMRRLSNIRFRISDGETGVRTYDGYVDGKWVLFSFDAKTGMMVYEFDDQVGSGEHELQVRVTDGVGNSSVYEASFGR